MKVELLQELDVRKTGWLVSRPFLTEDEIDWNEVLEMDFSLQDLRFLAFRIEASVFARELLVSFRPYFLWSSNSRIYVEDVKLDPDFPSDILELAKEQVAYFYKRSKEIHWDWARIEMPMATKAQFVMAFPYRVLASMLLTLREHPHPYVQKLVQSLADSAKIDLANLKFKPYKLPEVPAEDTYLEQSGMIFRVAEIPMSLRFQMVRHQGWQIWDDFYLRSQEYLAPTKPAKTPVRIAIMSSKSYWDKVVGVRHCWIAHYELWQRLMKPLEHYEDWIAGLPCHGSKEACKYVADAKNRLEGKENGIPCPLWDPRKEIVDYRLNELGSSRITEYYEEWLRRNGHVDG